MWIRFGRWVELGVHFGRQNPVEVLDRHLVYAAVRFGNREWTYGPRTAGRINALVDLPAPRIDLYPDPEPLRWGVRKVVSATSDSAIKTTSR